MKRIFVCIFNISFFFSYGQSSNFDSHIQNVNPTTPEAFAFTKYGGVPVTESSGLANLEIPLLNFTVGRIKVPISLNYATEGVKVDEMNGWAGMSWKLKAGGVITRNVNDKPDDLYFESSQRSSRLFYTKEQLESFDSGLWVYADNKEMFNLSRDWIDSEVDIFNFDFNGYSGSFFLDANFNPKLINYNTELKIEISNSSSYNLEILITTPDGIKYYFGGAQNSEITMVKYGLGTFSDHSQTALYLSKIVDVNGDEVYFNYLSDYSRKLIGYTQNFTKRYAAGKWNGDEGGCHTGSPFTMFQRLSLLSEGEIIQDNQGQKTLSSISSNRNNDQIRFTNFYDSQSQVKRRIVQDIALFTNNLKIKNVSFEYIQHLNRYFLYNLKFFGQGETQTNNKYTFEYGGYNNLPPRFSYSQDHLGYYNGKSSNTNFIPRVDNGILQVPFNFADRDANSNFSSKGTLTKVIYPAKGYTEFQYESGTEHWPGEYKKVQRSLNVYYNTPGNNMTQISNVISTAEDFNDFSAPSILNKDKAIDINIIATIQGNYSNVHKLRLTIDDLNSTTDYVCELSVENQSASGSVTISKLFSFPNLNSLGNYVFKLEYIKTDPLTPYPTSGNYIIGTAQISFTGNEPLIKDKLGLRIKSIADFSQSGSLGNYKRYYYNSYLNRLNSIDSQLNYKIPQYVSDEVEEIPCSIGTVGGAPCDPTIARDKVISSSSLNSIYAPGGSKYQYVTISYGGDNFENGGKEITFSVAEDSKIIEVFGPGSPTFFWNMLEFGKYSNTGLTNGTILEENYFKVASNNYAILQKKQYNYKEIPEKSGYLTNCFISKLFKRNACPSESNSGDNALEIGERNGQRFYMNYNIRNYYFGVYYTYYKWYNLDKVTTTDYFASGNIVTSEELFYDSKLAGLPSRKEVSGTNGITSTKYYYPHDLPTEFLMQDLIQANRYEQIRTESFVNNVKTFETKTAYAKDATTGNIARPKFEYAAKFPNSNPNLFTIGQLEKRATYDLYDPKGNILQFTQEGGISTSVIYGYNRMHPLAIIKNATFSEVLSALGTTEASLQTLIVAPSTIRTVLPSSLITTYNYKPLIGVSMITDEKGIKTYYNYDTDGRLKDVRDNQNYILSENDYKIKN